MTTNVNESLHSRLYLLCKKTHHYKVNHVNFAAQYTMSVHNHGYSTGSLFNNPGYGWNKHAFERLKRKDAPMIHHVTVPSKKWRDKQLMLKEGEILYGHDIASRSNDHEASTSNINDIEAEAPIIMHAEETHEHKNLLPDTTDLDSRNNEPWHNPDNPAPGYYDCL